MVPFVNRQSDSAKHWLVYQLHEHNLLPVLIAHYTPTNGAEVGQMARSLARTPYQMLRGERKSLYGALFFSRRRRAGARSERVWKMLEDFALVFVRRGSRYP